MGNHRDILLFKNQFLLSEKVCEELSEWKQVNFKSFFVYAHKHLEYTLSHSVTNDNQALLLGYIIDPETPGATNTQILECILKSESFDHLVRTLNELSGRFVLFIDFFGDLLIFNDPCGLKTLYYTGYNGNISFGSQPSILQLVAPLSRGKRYYEYYNSNWVNSQKEAWLPSGATLFENLNQLIPNHYLKIPDLKQVRYWPDSKRKSEDIDDVVAKVTGTLINQMTAISKRFDIAVALTAGLDSRMVLSSTKNIANDVFYYTLIYRDLTNDSNDISIPNRLLKRYGLVHNVIECKNTPDALFQEIYQKNTVPSHMHDWGEIAYNLSLAYPNKRIAVRGNCAEIARCFYYKYGTHKRIDTSEQMFEYVNSGWAEIPFIKDHIEGWFNSSIDRFDELGFDPLDLFYWEHRVGGWQAQSQLELDIVHETFNPFNHRNLLNFLLSTPNKIRCAPDYRLYIKIIEVLWCDILNLPINPPSFKGKILDVFGRLGIFDFAKNYYKKIKN